MQYTRLYIRKCTAKHAYAHSFTFLITKYFRIVTFPFTNHYVGISVVFLKLMSSACRRFMCDVCNCQTHHCAINIYQTNRLFRRFSSAPLEFVTTVSLTKNYCVLFIF